MTNIEILNLFDGLKELQDSKVPLNIKTSFILAKNNKIISELANLITDKQFEIYKKYGTSNDDGTITVPKENVPQLQHDVDELMNIDNNIDLTKINLNDLEDVKIEFGTIEKILPMIQE